MSDATERHRLEIEFCTQCRFQGRAFWMARELFDQVPELGGEIVLIPATGGVFIVRFDGEVVADYKTTGRFPEPKDVREAMLAASGRPPRPRSH